MYTITFSDNALRQLKKLERQIQERIINSIERIKVRPEMFVQRLVGDPGYKLRVGDYRLIMDISHESLEVIIIKIGHRKNIYDQIR